MRIRSISFKPLTRRPARRLAALCLIAAVSLALPDIARAQDDEPAASPARSNADRLEALQASLDRLEEEAVELRVQAARIAEEALQAQTRLRENLGDLRDSVDQLETEIGRLREIGDPFQTHEAAVREEAPAPPQTGGGAESAGEQRGDALGWPWWIDLFLIVVFCLALYLAFRSLVIPKSEREAARAPDEEIVEENELGTIRYPGAAADEGKQNGGGESGPGEAPREDEGKQNGGGESGPGEAPREDEAKRNGGGESGPGEAPRED